MVGFVHPFLRERRDAPDPEQSVEVVLVFEEGTNLSGITERLEAGDGEHIDTLPENIVIAEVPEVHLSEVCEYPNLLSISPDETMRVL